MEMCACMCEFVCVCECKDRVGDRCRDYIHVCKLSVTLMSVTELTVDFKQACTFEKIYGLLVFTP